MTWLHQNPGKSDSGGLLYRYRRYSPIPLNTLFQKYTNMVKSFKSYTNIEAICGDILGLSSTGGKKAIGPSL
jgi:hypothetical protein